MNRSHEKMRAGLRIDDMKPLSMDGRRAVESVTTGVLPGKPKWIATEGHSSVLIEHRGHCEGGELFLIAHSTRQGRTCLVERSMLVLEHADQVYPIAFFDRGSDTRIDAAVVQDSRIAEFNTVLQLSLTSRLAKWAMQIVQDHGLPLSSIAISRYKWVFDKERKEWDLRDPEGCAKHADERPPIIAGEKADPFDQGNATLLLQNPMIQPPTDRSAATAKWEI